MKSGGFTAKRALTRFTLLAKILIASSNGNAVLAEQAEKQDAMSEGRQSRQMMGSGFAICLVLCYTLPFSLNNRDVNIVE